MCQSMQCYKFLSKSTLLTNHEYNYQFLFMVTIAVTLSIPSIRELVKLTETGHFFHLLWTKKYTERNNHFYGCGRSYFGYTNNLYMMMKIYFINIILLILQLSKLFDTIFGNVGILLRTKEHTRIMISNRISSFNVSDLLLYSIILENL